MLEREQITSQEGSKYYVTTVTDTEVQFEVMEGDGFRGATVVPIDVLIQTLDLLDQDSGFKFSVEGIADDAKAAVTSTRTAVGGFLGRLANRVGGEEKKE